MDQHLIPPICMQVIIQSTAVWLSQIRAMYVHLFLPTYGAQFGNQALEETWRFFRFMGELGIFLPPPTIQENGKAVEGTVLCVTGSPMATKVLLALVCCLFVCFPHGKSFLNLSQFQGFIPHSVQHRTSGLCECKAARMKDWANTCCRGAGSFQSWARNPTEKVGRGMLR